MLKNKIAVITGASRGIGRDIAMLYASEGASLVLTCLNNHRALQTVEADVLAIGGKVITATGDVRDQFFCESLYLKTQSKFGVADILVNCAGTITRTPFESLSKEEWDMVINVNLYGAYNMCKKFLPDMRNNNYGKIINITSQMAYVPHPSASPSYEVSKSGLTALTKHLALQYAAYGVCVNAIAPGSINTDMPKSMTPEARERLRDAVPMKRLGNPSEVATTALFLGSDMSSYITGAVIDVNGGSLMR
jgi:3-oxoacyl-[acyl-carrier protein] reductase